MKKLIFFVLLVLFFASCTNQEPAAYTHGTARPTVDREGFTITLPDQINSIITIGASNTEIITALGHGGRIVATDIFSSDVYGLPAGVVAELDMLSLDAEFIVGLMPDIIFVTGMARAGGTDDPLAIVSGIGITVIYMPSSDSINAIMEDIRFIAAVLEEEEKGEALILDMESAINDIREVAATITETRTVYFEVYPAPWMVSLGTGTFLNEMLEIVGATNIFADQEGWFSVSDEELLHRNPDVILTSSEFMDDPVGEIMTRPGFDRVTAVQNGDVFLISANSSNRPSHNIVYALYEIAVAVFPEHFR